MSRLFWFGVRLVMALLIVFLSITNSNMVLWAS